MKKDKSITLPSKLFSAKLLDKLTKKLSDENNLLDLWPRDYLGIIGHIRLMIASAIYLDFAGGLIF